LLQREMFKCMTTPMGRDKDRDRYLEGAYPALACGKSPHPPPSAAFDNDARARDPIAAIRSSDSCARRRLKTLIWVNFRS